MKYVIDKIEKQSEIKGIIIEAIDDYTTDILAFKEDIAEFEDGIKERKKWIEELEEQSKDLMKELKKEKLKPISILWNRNWIFTT